MAGSDAVLEFLEFVEGQGQQSVRHLLATILRKSRLLTKAEAGTIFIVRRRGKNRWLHPASVQNEVVAVTRQDFVVPVGPGTIAGYVADIGRTVIIDDVYNIPKRMPYCFDPGNEHKNYRSHSMLCFPLKNYQDKVIGVVQLINCRPRKDRPPVPFRKDVENLITPISRVVGHSIERADMLEQIKSKNKTLLERNRLLDAQSLRITALQHETEEAFQISIRLLARAAEIHDEETGDHILRVNEYSYCLAKLMDLPAQWCAELRYSAQLHDVGKMSVDSAVLKKKGTLGPAERDEMNRHTSYGYQILSASPRLKLGAEIALFHHEKWDGSGYPSGVRGEAIPLSARIVQIADIYDALRSRRPYKPAFSHDKAVRILTRGDDRVDPVGHFDPRLLKLFAANHEQFARIWDQFAD